MNAVTILREVAQLAEASMAELVATYNALTGKELKKFESSEIGRRRVENAMMANKDADAHLGVGKGAEGEVKTLEELQKKAEEKGLEKPQADPNTDEEENPITFPPGSMADQLSKAADAMKKIEPRAKKAAKAPAVARNVLSYVKATGTGTSKVQAASQRGAVLAKVQSAHTVTTVEGQDPVTTYNPVAIADLDKHFDQSTKGFIQKLIEVKHLIACDAEGNPVEPGAAAPADTQTKGLPLEQDAGGAGGPEDKGDNGDPAGGAAEGE